MQVFWRKNKNLHRYYWKTKKFSCQQKVPILGPAWGVLAEVLVGSLVEKERGQFSTMRCDKSSACLQGIYCEASVIYWRRGILHFHSVGGITASPMDGDWRSSNHHIQIPVMVKSKTHHKQILVPNQSLCNGNAQCALCRTNECQIRLSFPLYFLFIYSVYYTPKQLTCIVVQVILN